MEIKNMTIDQIEARKAEIAQEIDKPDADLTALEQEIRSLNAELETRKAAEAKKAELRQAVAAGKGTVVKTFEAKSEKAEDVRNSKAYIDAYANYIKTGSDKECRALLTENVNGQLPVPTIVDEIVRTAWERDGIMSRVRKTYIRGNLKVAFELSATGAVVHTEGTDAPTEETLMLGIVTMIPANIKKWIRLSDEAVAMGGEAFLRYVYDELTYQIVKKEAALAIEDISKAAAASTATAVGVPAVALAPSVTTVATAAANLSDEAATPVVILNRLTEAEFVKAYAAGNFAVDPWAGYARVYTSALPAYTAANAGDVYAIVGDLRGEQFNYPEGDDVIIKWDDLSEAEADLVKVVGRVYAAHGVTAPGHFVNITKPEG